ncbi:uncharacterized protein TrAtP1_012966 [Trichoderma atroviride]|uniref:uncharacterized protein n=1 Tax=Hypocrea atroviridis TaxID=63577 RepID=UPI00331E6AAA|nr:hypothetical protein TrAtP1_012966 [Trichoderma atroviride]
MYNNDLEFFPFPSELTVLGPHQNEPTTTGTCTQHFRLSLMVKRINCVRVIALNAISAQADKRHSRAAGPLPFDMLEKVVLATGLIRAATLKSRRSMGHCCFKVPSKVFFEPEKLVAI